MRASSKALAITVAGAMLAVAPASAVAADNNRPADGPRAAALVASSGGGIVDRGSTVVVDGQKVDRPVDIQAGDISASGCWYVTWSRWASNVFGMRLFTYYQRLDWCGSSGRISSPSRTRWPDASFPGWEFKGHIGTVSQGGSGATYWRAFTQGSFCLASYFSCVQNKYPWIDMTVTPYGGVSGSTGGT